MAKLELTYKTEDEIPEAAREWYTEKDGAWHLTEVNGLKSAADFAKIEAAKRREVEAHRATKAKLEAWGDRNADEVLAELDKIEEYKAAAEGKLDDAKIEEIVGKRLAGKLAPVERERDRWKRERDEFEGSVKDYQAKDRRRTILDGIRAAGVKAKVIPEAMEDVELWAERVFDVGDDGSVLTKEGVGITPGLAPLDALSEIQERRPHWWPASTGGGAKGSSGGGGRWSTNPWSERDWSVTEQARVLKENPDRGKQMAAAAGVDVHAIAPAANGAVRR